MKLKSKNNKGFSLIELIVVIAIMAVLVGVITPVLIKQIEKARKSKCLTQMDNLARAYEIELYSYIDGDYYEYLDQFMKANRLEKVGNGEYSDGCPSGGKYKIELDTETGAIMSFTCSKHTDNKVEATPSNYITYLSKGFLDYLNSASGTTTEYDSGAMNASNSYANAALEQLKSSLASAGLEMTDTCMWRVLYNENKSSIKVYWVDTGEKIDSKQTNVQGSWMTFDINTGKKLDQEDNASISIGYKDNNYGKYYYIENSGDFFSNN